MSSHGSEARLKALREGYAVKLAGRLGSLRRLVEGAKHGDARALAQAIREAHKLHGTAGSYGFVEVSTWMGETERMLNEISEGGREDYGPVLELIGRAEGCGATDR